MRFLLGITTPARLPLGSLCSGTCLLCPFWVSFAIGSLGAMPSPHYTQPILRTQFRTPHDKQNRNPTMHRHLPISCIKVYCGNKHACACVSILSSAYPSTSFYIHMYMCLSICSSIHLPIHNENQSYILPIYLPICISEHISLHLYVYLSLYCLFSDMFLFLICIHAGVHTQN